jgi:hypothetical protein
MPSTSARSCPSYRPRPATNPLKEIVERHLDELVDVCPSCGQRRAIAWAERMVEEVLPDVPYLQLVFTIPKMLRRAFLFDSTPHSAPTTSSSADSSSSPGSFPT